MKDFVFLYGTLLTGTRHRNIDHIVHRYCRPLGPAFIVGRLYSLGRYPGGVFTNNGSERIYGRLYYLKNAEKCLGLLDRYEEYNPAAETSSEFIRKKVKTYRLPVPTHHKVTEAWVYLYNYPISHRPRIYSGRYRK